MSPTNIANVNSSTYRLTASAASQAFTVTGAANTDYVIVRNNTNVAIAIASGLVGMTVTFPAAGASTNTQVILPGSTESFRKTLSHTHVAVICQAAPSTTDVYVTFGGV